MLNSKLLIKHLYNAFQFYILNSTFCIAFPELLLLVHCVSCLRCERRICYILDIQVNKPLTHLLFEYGRHNTIEIV
jgi:hypothetical protein